MWERRAVLRNWMGSSWTWLIRGWDVQEVLKWGILLAVCFFAWRLDLFG